VQPPGFPEGYEPASPQIDRGRLESACSVLEARDRAVLLASFVDDHDADEIGHALQLTPGNVRVIRHRALARLRPPALTLARVLVQRLR
jgi:RNA polymerase sigma-70 factor, ECF subfamily